MDTTTLGRADLDRMTSDDRWLGFGYLGERANAHPRDRRSADEAIINAANLAGLDYDGLFEWANSKTGRWAGDVLFGDSFRPMAQRVADALRFDLLPKAV